ncbi:MAG TPA: radical SAM protein [Armatimonadota bacterium]|nr:radical SAM protein [Armatimonadota bacterium]
MSYKLTQNVKNLLADERGTIYKPHGNALKFALAFPNSYRLGMSNLGFQLVYRLLNERPDTVCERTFLPDPTEEQEHRRSHMPLFSWESQRPIGEFDVIGFSVSFEMDYVNVLRMLELAGMPLLAEERDESYPLVIMGGPAPWVNPEAVAPFVDAIVIGEAEGLTDLLIPPIQEYLDAGRDKDKRALLRRLSQVQGIYVPALYDFRYNEDGTIAEIIPLEDAPLPVRRWVARDLHKYNTSAQILTPNTEFSNMMLAETARGCGQGCRFCFAGYAYRPVRYTPPEQLEKEFADRQAQEQEPLRVGLVGSSLTDHKQLVQITRSLAEKASGVSLASIRADNLTEAVACAIGEAGQKTITLAPETGSERLRYIARKHVTDEDVVVAAERCAANKVEKIKLYYIVGLPCEVEHDMLAVADLSARVLKAGNFRKVTLTLHPFVPKPHTGYQWAGSFPPAEMERRLKAVGRAVRQASNKLEFTVDSVRGSHVQGVLAMADRRVAAALLEAHRNGGNWKSAFRDTGIDSEWYACRPRSFEEVLPWEHIHLGVKKEYLWREWQRALELDRETRDQPNWSYGAHGASATDAAGEPSRDEALKQLEFTNWG